MSDQDNLHARLQCVIHTRDQLLTWIYELLETPHGIMLADIPDAIAAHKAMVTAFRERCESMDMEGT